MTTSAHKKESIYIAYDEKTGVIVHTHQRFDVETDKAMRCDLDEIKAMAISDPRTVQKLTNQTAENLGVIELQQLHDHEIPLSRYFLVDPASKSLKRKPRLHLIPEKTKLQGNGTDSVRIQINVVGEKDKPIKYEGTVKVKTSRGKLSSEAGIVNVVGGKGAITLTSVNETIAQVKVTVASLERTCIPDGVDLEFI